MAHRALAPQEIETKLATLNAAAGPPWTLAAGKLHKEFRFDDFIGAFAFMTAAALVAERMNHHPEWFNVYGTVRVDLVTHDVQGISERDFTLAGAMDALAAVRR